MSQHPTRPLGVTLLSCFFMFGALAPGLAALMLLRPGSPLDLLWRINPRGHQGFIAAGQWAIVLLCAVSLACAAAAFGLWHCRRWGYRIAIVLLSINLLSDAINAFWLQDWRTAIGLPVAGLMIAYLVRSRKVFS